MDMSTASALGKRKRGGARQQTSTRQDKDVSTVRIVNGKMVRMTASQTARGARPTTSSESSSDERASPEASTAWRGSRSAYRHSGPADEQENMSNGTTGATAPFSGASGMQAGPTPSSASASPSASTSQPVPIPASPSKHLESAPRKPVNRRSRYHCTWEGCSKTYTKPVRLAEHMRSHTGDRPFKCTFEGCDATYLRETHLAAHLRTHKGDSEKPLACDEEGCGKRFWTSQHLKRHVKLVHEKDKDLYKCDDCGERFNKHHKLRSHIAEEHMPEGTKPFICTAEGCEMSFSTGSKLRTHAKIHDNERYVCLHSSHPVGEKPKFSNWTALQAHNRTAHPPICPHAECKGKEFSSNKQLKKHMMRRHVDGVEEQIAESAESAEEPTSTETEGETDGDRDQHTGGNTGENGGGKSARAARSGSRSTRVDTTSGNSAEMRLAGASRQDRHLIPTEPVAPFADFDGEADYEEEEEEDEDEDDVQVVEGLLRQLAARKK